MNNKILLLIILVIFFFSNIGYSQNPFFKNKKTDITKDLTLNKTDNLFSYPSFIKKIFHETNRIQQKLNKYITTLVKEIKNSSKKALFIIFLISFIYGIIHAIGPGHGKAVVSSYFISNNSDISKGITVGSIIALVHVLSAIIITLSLYYIVKSTILANFENINLIMKKISYSLIVLIGLIILFKSFYNLKFSNKSELLTEQKKTSDNNRNIIKVALIIGIVPCPGATMILLFTLNYNLLYAGIISVIFMSAGMALTVSLFAIITILIKKYSFKFIPKEIQSRNIFSFSTEVLGGFLVLFLGIILLYGIV